MQIPLKYLTALNHVASTDETRFILNGVLLENANGKALGVATDGRRLITANFHIDMEDMPNVLIPSEAIMALDVLETGFDVDISLSDDKSTLRLSRATRLTVVVENMLVHGQYPKWRIVLPKNIDAPFDAKGICLDAAYLHEIALALVELGAQRMQLVLTGGQDNGPYVIRPNNSVELMALLMPVRESNGVLEKPSLPNWIN